MAQKKKFAGDKKKGKSILHTPERWLKYKLTSLTPNCIETYHLTLTTVLWSILVVYFSFLALNNIKWLYAVCLMIVLQYLTDLIDGEVGRQRNTGLIKFQLTTYYKVAGIFGHDYVAYLQWKSKLY